jgi:hypothetical protein
MYKAFTYLAKAHNVNCHTQKRGSAPHVAFTVAVSTHSNGNTRHSHTIDSSYGGLAGYKPTNTRVMVGFPTYNSIYDSRVHKHTG